MYLHIKQSGELLTSIPGQPWTRDAVYISAQHIKELCDKRDELQIEGVLVVSGAGNILRGEKMRDTFKGSNMSIIADTVGRIATIQNTIMLSAALHDMKVPHVIFSAPGMTFADGTFGKMQPYDVQAVHQAYESGSVVLTAGGSGKDNQTTDAAVLDFLVDHAQQFPGSVNVAHKTTHFDGVFEEDPRRNPGAKHFRRLSAQYMLDNYQRLGAVDRRCLEVLRNAPKEAAMIVYSATKYTPAQAVAAWSLGNLPGTLLVPGDAAPLYDS